MSDLPDVKDRAVADVTRWGVPWHGRIEDGTLHAGAGITRDWPQPGSGDCFLIRVPGLPDPYAAPAGSNAEVIAAYAAEKAADAARGMELTNYALLASGTVHSKTIPGQWLWIDDDGKAYSVNCYIVDGVNVGFAAYGVDYDFTSAITVRFALTSFGHITQNGEPSASTVTVDHVIAANGLGQSTPSLAGVSGGNIVLASVNATGSKATFKIYCSTTDSAKKAALYGSEINQFTPLSIFTRPIGFVEFSLSGPGSSPNVSMVLLASRADALGTVTPGGSYTTTFLSTGCETTPAEPTDIIVSASADSTFEQNTTADFLGRIIGYLYVDDVATQVTLNFSVSAVVSSSKTESYSSPGGSTISSESHEVLTSSLTIIAGSQTLSTSKIQDRVYSGSESTSETTYTWSGTGITTRDSTGSGSGETPADPSVLCAADVNETTLSDYPNYASHIEYLYDMEFGGIYGNFLDISTFRYSSSVFAVRINNGLSPVDSGYEDIVAGCLSETTVDSSTHPISSATHAAYNPATGELAYPKTMPVNFT